MKEPNELRNIKIKSLIAALVNFVLLAIAYEAIGKRLLHDAARDARVAVASEIPALVRGVRADLIDAVFSAPLGAQNAHAVLIDQVAATEPGTYYEGQKSQLSLSEAMMANTRHLLKTTKVSYPVPRVDTTNTTRLDTGNKFLGSVNVPSLAYTPVEASIKSDISLEDVWHDAN